MPFSSRATKQLSTPFFAISQFPFPGTTQYSSEPAPADINIKVCINSVNPLNWISVGNELKQLRPDIVVVRYWLPFMGPCLGTILRHVKERAYKIVAIADNVIPYENELATNSSRNIL